MILRGALPFRKPGHADMGAVLQISLLNGVFKLLSFHLDGQLHGALFFLSTLVTFMFPFPPVGAWSPLGNSPPFYFRLDILTDVALFDQRYF